MKCYHDLVDEYGIESYGITTRHCAPDFHSVVYARAYVDEWNEKEIEAVRKVEAELNICVRRFGGACRIGLNAEDGRVSELNLMERIKQLIDVNNIMNPGKKFKGF